MMMVYVPADQLLRTDNLNVCSRYFSLISSLGYFKDMSNILLLIRCCFKPKKFVKLFNNQESLKQHDYVCLLKERHNNDKSIKIKKASHASQDTYR